MPKSFEGLKQINDQEDLNSEENSPEGYPEDDIEKETLNEAIEEQEKILQESVVELEQLTEEAKESPTVLTEEEETNWERIKGAFELTKTKINVACAAIGIPSVAAFVMYGAEFSREQMMATNIEAIIVPTLFLLAHVTVNFEKAAKEREEALEI